MWTPIGTLETTLWSQPPVLRRRPAGSQASRAAFGSGEFDGQGSGHDFNGTLYMPPSGYVNSCDGGRSHSYCDYRQQ